MDVLLLIIFFIPFYDIYISQISPLPSPPPLSPWKNQSGFSPRRGRERALFRQTVDAAQQKFDLSIGCAGSILRHHVTGQADLDPGQTALRVSGAEDAGSCQGAQAWVVMVGHEELVRWLLLEPLEAVPRHVLNHQQRAVRDEDEVQLAVGDDGPVETLDDAGQNGEAARRGVVLAENAAGAFFPRLNGRVDGFLHVSPIEINFPPLR